MIRQFLAIPLLFSLAACSTKSDYVVVVSGENIAQTDQAFVQAGSVTDIPRSIFEPQEGYNEGSLSNGVTGRLLGEGIASLGDPSRTGLWVEAPFIEAHEDVAVYTDDGLVFVIAQGSPNEGMVQMSLAAFQALKKSPADLVPVQLRKVR